MLVLAHLAAAATLTRQGPRPTLEAPRDTVTRSNVPAKPAVTTSEEIRATRATGV
jgi:hypothetical protein